MSNPAGRARGRQSRRTAARARRTRTGARTPRQRASSSHRRACDLRPHRTALVSVDDLDAPGRRQLHAQLLARDLLDARRHAPTSTARAAAGRTRSRAARARACSRSSSTNSLRDWWRDVTSDSAHSDQAATSRTRLSARHAPTRPYAARPVGGPAARPCAARRAARRCARADCAAISASPGLMRAADRRPAARAAAPSARTGSRASRGSPLERQRCARHEALDDAVLERMEADHGEPPARRQQRAPARGSAATARQLLVHLQSEGPGRSAWPDPDANHPASACRRLRRRSRPVAACVTMGCDRARRRNCSCNRLSKPFLTIVADDLRQFAHAARAR